MDHDLTAALAAGIDIAFQKVFDNLIVPVHFSPGQNTLVLSVLLRLGFHFFRKESTSTVHAVHLLDRRIKDQRMIAVFTKCCHFPCSFHKQGTSNKELI